MNFITYSFSNTFFNINNKLTSISKCSFTFVFFEAACHANSGAVSKQAGSSAYISRHISNTSAKNTASPETHKS